MTREELLKIAKPILFNTEMVKAILDGRKTVTRRVIRPQPTRPRWNNIGWLGFDDGHGYKMRQPCDIGDILYVRETWIDKPETAGGGYHYKADSALSNLFKWRPSIHMPKEATRIFLRVTNVRVERLKDMTENDVYDEGAAPLCDCPNEREIYLPEGGIEACWSVLSCPNCSCDESYPETFGKRIWNSTIKKSDLDKYGWEANPWVWVIEFERVEI